MSDIQPASSPPKYKPIDVNDWHDVRNWSQTFGVTPERLKDVVNRVGNSSETVRRYIRGDIHPSGQTIRRN